MNREAMRFGIVGQLPLGMVAWLRDVFDLEQQVVTSALTTNCLCPVAPSVLGTSWGDSLVGYHWMVTVYNFCPDQTGPVTPWAHRCLLVLNEPRQASLTSMGKIHGNCKVAESGTRRSGKTWGQTPASETLHASLNNGGRVHRIGHLPGRYY